MGAAHKSILEQHAKCPMDDLGGGVKGTGIFEISFIKNSSANFLEGTLSYNFHLLYVLLVQKNFDSGESIFSVFIESVHRNNFADDFIIT